jgi:hypothetical protein
MGFIALIHFFPYHFRKDGINVIHKNWYCRYICIQLALRRGAIACHLLRNKALADHEGKKEKSELSSSARNDMLGVESPLYCYCCCVVCSCMVGSFS